MSIFNVFSRFYWHYIASPEKYARHLGVHIGDNCLIGIRWWPTEPYLIHIGNHVQITNDVQIHTHGGANVVRKYIPDFDLFGKVVIEDWAYIGAGTLIMPGCTIGEGSLVAAGSVVTKSVPPHTIVGGNPAKVICSVSDFIAKNEQYNVSTKGLSSLDKKKYLLSLPEEKFVTK